LVLCVLLFACACIIDIDYGETVFSCRDSPVCPSGSECRNRICVPTDEPDADVDADADAGARPDAGAAAVATSCPDPTP
jgi:hypothetical protein